MVHIEPVARRGRRGALWALATAWLVCGYAQIAAAQDLGTHICKIVEGSSIVLTTTLGPIALDTVNNGNVRISCGEVGPQPVTCPGDCDEDGAVHINESILGVRVGLGQEDVAECANVDVDGSGDVEINELVTQVGSTINGCPTGTGAECTCDIIDFAPLNLSGIGFVCNYPAPGCEPGKISCDGGNRIGVDLYSERVIGECDSNEGCRTQCEEFCADRGTVPTVTGFGCEGYCLGGERDGERCDCDGFNPVSCTPGPVIGGCPGGECPGQNRAPGGVCQCQCVDNEVGRLTEPGGLTCNLGSTLIVEQTVGVPCDGQDILVSVGTVCIPMTTDTATAVLHNVNDQMVCQATKSPCANNDECDPGDTCGFNEFEESATGSPLTCEQFAEDITGLHVEGVVDFFGSDLGDILTQVTTVCEEVEGCPLQAGSYTMRQTSGGTLRVDGLPPFPFPQGGEIIADVAEASQPNCVHNVTVSGDGGFSAPVFCVPGLNFTVLVSQTGCGVGRIDSNGGSDFTVTEIGDTSAPESCDMPASTCPPAPGTGPGDSNVRVDVTVGDGNADTCATGTANVIVSIPVFTRTWQDQTFMCPDPDGVFDPGSDSLVVEFPQILDFTTDTNSADWSDLEADGCCIAGSGPSSKLSPCQEGGTGGPSSSGACLDLTAMTVTTAASGPIGSMGQPLFDLTFTTRLPNAVEGPEPLTGATCAEPPVIDFDGTAMRCIR